MWSPDWEQRPHLMNINEDPLLTGHIRHILEDGVNKIGKQSKIKIGGLGITVNHAELHYEPLDE